MNTDSNENAKGDVDGDWDVVDSISDMGIISEEQENETSKLPTYGKRKPMTQGHSAKAIPIRNLLTDLDREPEDMQISPRGNPGEETYKEQQPHPATNASKAVFALEQGIRHIGFQSSPEFLPKSMQIALGNRFTLSQVHRFREDSELAFSHPLPYFFSGSFMFPATLRAVTKGRSLRDIAESMTPSTLRGYKLCAVKRRPWPAMLPSSSPNDEVKGMVVFGMLDSQRKAIHAFENGMFDLRRVNVEIELQDGSKMTHEAGIYVWNQSESLLVPPEQKQWSPSSLMQSQWFLSNITLARAEEEQL